MRLNKIDFTVNDISDLELEKKIRKSLRSDITTSVSLGYLENIIVHCGLILKTQSPQLKKPALLMFAADHGIAENNFPATKSYLKTLGSLQGTSPVSILCNQNNVALRIIDLGVNFNFESSFSFWYHHGKLLSSKKIAFSTRNFTQFPAMTSRQCEQAFDTGVNAVLRVKRNNGNVVALSSLNSDNHISAITVASALLEEDTEILTEKALNDEQKKLVSRALNKHPKTHDPFTILTLFGGFETVALCGAIIEAARQQMIIIIDGLTALVALTVAETIKPGVKKYCVSVGTESHFLRKNLNLKAYTPESIEEEGINANLMISLVRSALSLNNR